MKLKHAPLLRENKTFLKENIKLAKQYLSQGKLSQEDLDMFIKMDPTPQRKYVGWLAKIWIAEKPDVDELRNSIEEYDTLLNRGKTKTKDIYTLKSLEDLKNELDHINKTGDSMSLKDLESDYETIIDNANLLIMTPHTHEASRKLGLSHFAYRDCGDGGKDSSWCTTYKAPDHFNDYYYNNNVTFYYIKIKSAGLQEKLKAAFPHRWQKLVVTALAVLEDGQIDGYDGTDKQMKQDEISKFTKIIGIS